MDIHELSYVAKPHDVRVSGGEKMRARAVKTEHFVWLSLGTQGEPEWRDNITIFIEDANAYDKAERIAAAINAILAEGAAPAATLSIAAE